MSGAGGHLEFYGFNWASASIEERRSHALHIGPHRPLHNVGCSFSPRSKIRFLQPLSEVALPAFGQGRDSQGAVQGSHVVIAVPFGDVQPSDFRDGDGVGVASNRFDLVTGADLSL